MVCSRVSIDRGFVPKSPSTRSAASHSSSSYANGTSPYAMAMAQPSYSDNSVVPAQVGLSSILECICKEGRMDPVFIFCANNIGEYLLREIVYGIWLVLSVHCTDVIAGAVASGSSKRGESADTKSVVSSDYCRFCFLYRTRSFIRLFSSSRFVFGNFQMNQQC